MTDNDLDPGPEPLGTQIISAGIDTFSGTSILPSQPKTETTSPKTISTIIADQDDQISPEVDVAQRVIACLGEDWQQLVLPLVTNAVAEHRRNQVRRVEHEIGVRPAPKGRSVKVRQAQAASDMAAFAKLLDKTLKIPGESPTTWGQATVTQHMNRVAALNAHIQGTERTRDLHLSAVNLCRSQGVERLNELFSANQEAAQ